MRSFSIRLDPTQIDPPLCQKKRISHVGFFVIETTGFATQLLRSDYVGPNPRKSVIVCGQKKIALRPTKDISP